MVCPESFFKLCSSKPSVRREHGHVILPPCARGTPQLLGCQSCFIPIIVRVQGEFGLDGPKPTVRFQWLIRLMEERWLCGQKLRVSRSRWLVVMFRPRHSALVHDLTEERRLLVSSGEHGRNGQSQIRRVRGCCHSAFNHDWISPMILITKQSTMEECRKHNLNQKGGIFFCNQIRTIRILIQNIRTPHPDYPDLCPEYPVTPAMFHTIPTTNA